MQNQSVFTTMLHSALQRQHGWCYQCKSAQYRTPSRGCQPLIHSVRFITLALMNHIWFSFHPVRVMYYSWVGRHFHIWRRWQQTASRLTLVVPHTPALARSSPNDMELPMDPTNWPNINTVLGKNARRTRRFAAQYHTSPRSHRSGRGDKLLSRLPGSSAGKHRHPTVTHETESWPTAKYRGCLSPSKDVRLDHPVVCGPYIKSRCGDWL